MDTPATNLGPLYKALAAAQGEMAGAKKDSTNPFFRSTYADLHSCWAACREPLSKNGLSIVQLVSAEDERLAEPIVMAQDNGKTKTIYFVQRVTVETILGHESGGEIRSRLTVLVKDDSAQGTGSGTSYARRYSLCAMVGIAPEDDDGHAAAAPQSPQEQRRAAPKATPKVKAPADPVDWEGLKGVLKLMGIQAGDKQRAEAVTKFASGLTLDDCYSKAGSCNKVMEALTDRQGAGESLETIYKEALKAAGMLTTLDKQGEELFGG